MKLLLVIFSCFGLIALSHAAETPWQEVYPGVKLRLVSTGQVSTGGRTQVGLEIDMPQDTRTYWRVPGETGFPLALDTSGSMGIDGATVSWPYPTREVANGYTDYVYWGPTLLPIELIASTETPDLVLSAVLGICSDVCVPAQLKFELPLALSTPDRANAMRIRQALALAPIEWDGADAPIDGVRYDPVGNVLVVSVNDSLFDPQTLIATGPEGGPIFGAPQKSPEPGLILLPVLGTNAGNSLENQTIQFTFVTGMGAFSLTQRVKAMD